jgi:hypothetical protein
MAALYAPVQTSFNNLIDQISILRASRCVFCHPDQRGTLQQFFEMLLLIGFHNGEVLRALSILRCRIEIFVKYNKSCYPVFMGDYAALF